METLTQGKWELQTYVDDDGDHNRLIYDGFIRIGDLMNAGGIASGEDIDGCRVRCEQLPCLDDVYIEDAPDISDLVGLCRAYRQQESQWLALGFRALTE